MADRPKLDRPGRIPDAVDGLQVNFCKNPACANFGIPAPVERGRPGHQSGPPATYRAQHVGGAVPGLLCMKCGEAPTVKSNRAISEELQRMLLELELSPPPGCSTPSCANEKRAIGSLEHYQAFGKTAGGSARYRCKACGRVASLRVRSTLRQREHEKNHMIFSLLMNKSPMRRICEVADINPKTLYQRIGFFYEQCRRFGAEHERRLFTDFKAERLYVSVDRQDYIMNWTNQADRRNVALHAVGSADQRSSYVFGMHLDFDRSMDAVAVEADHAANPELHLAHAFRRYARVWLLADYTDSLREFRRMKKAKERARAKSLRHGAGVIADVAMTYEEVAERPDTEVADLADVDQQLPPRGMQVHSEYTLYGHFFYLERLLRNVGKVRFFLDQESGIRAACLAAFCERVKNRTTDAFYVRIDKTLTVNERRKVKAKADERFHEALDRFPGMTGSEVQIELIKEQIAKMRSIGKWSDRWLMHPFPSMSEPDKAVCCLTDLGDYQPDHLARLYQLASLHAIDRFFMQLRRRVSLLERPIKTASNQLRVWYGYSPYNPEVADKILTIFRVFYNYVIVGEDKKTPAMRLGLAQAPYKIQDLVDFVPREPFTPTVAVMLAAA